MIRTSDVRPAYPQACRRHSALHMPARLYRMSPNAFMHPAVADSPSRYCKQSLPGGTRPRIRGTVGTKLAAHVSICGAPLDPGQASTASSACDAIVGPDGCGMAIDKGGASPSSRSRRARRPCQTISTRPPSSAARSRLAISSCVRLRASSSQSLPAGLSAAYTGGKRAIASPATGAEGELVSDVAGASAAHCDLLLVVGGDSSSNAR